MISPQNNNNSVRYLSAKISKYILEYRQIDINDFILEFEGYSPISILLALSQLTKGINKQSVKLTASNLLIELYSLD